MSAIPHPLGPERSGGGFTPCGMDAALLLALK
jgi:hypothetical protein